MAGGISLMASVGAVDALCLTDWLGYVTCV